MFKVGDKVKININNLRIKDLDKEDIYYICLHQNKIYEIVEVLKKHPYPYVIDDEDSTFNGGIGFSEDELIKVEGGEENGVGDN